MLIGKNLLPYERIISFQSKSHSERIPLPREANKKSHDLPLFVKLIEKHGGVSCHFLT